MPSLMGQACSTTGVKRLSPAQDPRWPLARMRISTSSVAHRQQQQQQKQPPPPVPVDEVAIDPMDMETALAEWKKAEEMYGERLKKAGMGGRFDPEILGKLVVRIGRVEIATPVSSKTKASDGTPLPPPPPMWEEFPLRELAQVVQGKGRNVSVLAYEQRFVKPIMSAVQNSHEYNQQPQRGQDDLELILKTERQTPAEIEAAVATAANAWRRRVRDIAAKRDKQIKIWRSTKSVLRDSCTKAANELRRQQDLAMQNIDKMEKEQVRKIKASQL